MSDDPIPFNRVPDHIPGRPNLATLWRWRQKGVAGVKLVVEYVGGRVYVSRAELSRFLAAVNAAKQPGGDVTRAKSRESEIAASKRRVAKALKPKARDTSAA